MTFPLPYMAGSVNESSVAVTRTFIGSDVDASASTSHTFSSKSLSTADANRDIVVTVAMEGATASADSVTVAGIAAVKAVSLTLSATETVDIWIAPVPTGTTGDIVVATPDSTTCGIGWTAMYDANSTADDTASNSAAPASTTINCPANGAIFGVVMIRSNTDRTWTWTGITEDYDEFIVTGDSSHSGASDLFATQQTGLTVTATASGAGVRNPVMALASFGPL
jgi:hypothetical protein